MMHERTTWGWVGALSTGTGHLATGESCQDFGACVEFSRPNGEAVLLAIVSDGAGSAPLGRVGARIACLSLAREIGKHLRNHQYSTIDTDLARRWLSVVQSDVQKVAERAGMPLRAYAATLVSAMIYDDAATVLQVGDGGCALRASNGAWHVPVWPMHGEYASSTYFVTDRPQPNFCLATLQENIGA